MSEEKEYIHGTPTMVLLSAQNYIFRVLDDVFKISIPRRGAYHDLAPDFFSIEDGEFNILDINKNVLLLPSISKVLFATKKYPDLKPNQLFAPLYLVFNENEVEIVGHVLEVEINKGGNSDGVS